MIYEVEFPDGQSKAYAANVGDDATTRTDSAPPFFVDMVQDEQSTTTIRTAALGRIWRMMGIPCEGPAYIHGNNQSVLASCGIPDSILKEKSQSIAFHFVCEGAARDEWRSQHSR
jgi:hypothetical protein